MDPIGLGPTRQAGHDIEFAKQPGNQLFGVGVFGEAVHFGDDLEKGGFCAADGLVAVVLTLGLQAFVMLDELLAVEGGEGRRTWRYGVM